MVLSRDALMQACAKIKWAEAFSHIDFSKMGPEVSESGMCISCFLQSWLVSWNSSGRIFVHEAGGRRRGNTRHHPARKMHLKQYCDRVIRDITRHFILWRWSILWTSHRQHLERSGLIWHLTFESVTFKTVGFPKQFRFFSVFILKILFQLPCKIKNCYMGYIFT